MMPLNLDPIQSQILVVKILWFLNTKRNQKKSIFFADKNANEGFFANNFKKAEISKGDK